MENEKVIEVLDGKLKEYKDGLSAQFKTAQDTIDAEVKKLNEELTKKGATIAELQGEVKELKTKGGRIGAAGKMVHSYKSVITEAIQAAGENFGRLAKAEGGIKMDTKTVGDMTSANLTSDAYHTYLDWRPGMRPMGQIRFRDLVRTIPSGTDYVQFHGLQLLLVKVLLPVRLLRVQLKIRLIMILQ